MYDVEDLGPKRFRLNKHVFIRRDLELKNEQGFELVCSHFVPAKSPDAKRPCVVYLHGNSSSRFESFSVLPFLLQKGLTVFCLDLSGSGLSGGEYISLGWHEEQDLRTVLEHLRRDPTVSSIGLWGRSMGAATAVLRASKDDRVSACVLDSPFASLNLVATEVVQRSFKVPKFLVNAGIQMLRREVRAKANFDVLELVPERAAYEASCPALFGAAEDDCFVLPHHARKVYEAWAGEKSLFDFTGGHNGPRPPWFLEEGSCFLAQKLYQAGGAEAPAFSRLSRDASRTPTASAPRKGPSVGARRHAEVATARRGGCLVCCSKQAAVSGTALPRPVPPSPPSPASAASTTASEGEAQKPSQMKAS